MKVDVRSVVDTNVLISAVLTPERTAFRAVERVFERGVLFQSPDLLEELRSRIYRPKFDRYISNDDRRRFIKFVAERSVLIEPQEVLRVSRDPDDDKLLELAVAVEANVIISGDRDLLVLNAFQDIPILTPTQFLEWLED